MTFISEKDNYNAQTIKLSGGQSLHKVFQVQKLYLPHFLLWNYISNADVLIL